MKNGITSTLMAAAVCAMFAAGAAHKECTDKGGTVVVAKK